jgi:predicted DNA-binding protein
METTKASYLLNLEVDLMDRLNEISEKLDVTKRKLIVTSLENYIEYLETVYIPEFEKMESNLSKIIEIKK